MRTLHSSLIGAGRARAASLAAVVSIVMLGSAAVGAQSASAAFSHSLYSFKNNTCRVAARQDPVSVTISENGLTADGAAQYTKAWTGWGANRLGSTNSQYGRDHGQCTKFNKNNASSIIPTKSRYHVRWHAGNAPLSNGREYVVGTPHYDKRCEGRHHILSWDGPRDMIARGAKAHSWDIYYTHENNVVDRVSDCLLRKYPSRPDAGHAIHDGNLLHVRPN